MRPIAPPALAPLLTARPVIAALLELRDVAMALRAPKTTPPIRAPIIWLRCAAAMWFAA